MRRLFVFFLLSAALFGVLSPEAWAISKRDEGIRLGMELRSRILAGSYHSRSELLLWKKLFNGPFSNHEDRIGAGLALVDRIFPNGDPSRWEQVSGFLEGLEVPRSLAAADAVLFTAYLAVETLPSPDGMWLAYVLMEPFFRSDAARIAFGRTCPHPVAGMMDKMTKAGVSPPEGWPEPFEVVGFMPIGAPVSGSVDLDQVALYGMWRLDSNGRIRADAKSLAWDRTEGAIYRISQEE